MKKIYSLFILLLLPAFAVAQIVDIPDANFKAKLLSANTTNSIAKDDFGNKIKIDLNNDLEIQQGEALTVYEINVESSDIVDMTGVGLFSNLKKLNCGYNDIVTLNLNGLNTLKELYCNDNNLSALNLSISSIEKLDCGKNYYITSLDLTNVPNITDLICTTNNLTSLNLSGLHNLKSVQCANNTLLSSFNVNGCINLESLNCAITSLTTLNISNLPSLKKIYLNNTQITNVNMSGTSNIEEFYCSGTPLTSLNLSAQSNLRILDCQNNNLSTLNISGITTLTGFTCNDNNLTSLNLSPCPGLVNFNCFNNHIGGTMDLSAFIGLIYLNCNNNLLSGLILPHASFYNLDCSHNLLTALDFAGSSVQSILDCSYNQIQMLDLEGVSTPNFYCNNNQLSSLNASGSTGITNINCSNNVLTTLDFSNLPVLSIFNAANNNLHTLYIKNGHTTVHYKFPNNPDIEYICVTASRINQIINKLNTYGITTCEVNSYCTYTPGAFYDIIGSPKLDYDSNGCDNGDIKCRSLKFNITNGITNGSIVSDTSGNWNIPVQAGTHTITPAFENPTYFNVSPVSAMVTFPGDATPNIQNFCITPVANHPDVEIVLFNTNAGIPGFDATYKIIYKNKGTTMASGSVNFSFNDAALDFILASPATDSQSTGMLFWNYTNLYPFEIRTITFTLNLNSPVETPALNQGDVLHFSANISLASDESPANNAAALNQTVFNAFDPNDKTCLEGDTITPQMVGGYVHYKIRFENTGNYPAAIVTVKDVIDTSKFDISTLTPITASHPFITRISNTNQVEFVFDNIMLPFDDANNDGYVVFKIKTKPTLVLGDQLSNTAGIYFNYNAPVITNTAVTTVAVPLGVNNNDNAFGFALYPNPAKNTLNISTKTNATINEIIIYNTLGQQVMKVLPAAGDYSIDVSGLPIGGYIVKVGSETTSWTAQFLKE